MSTKKFLDLPNQYACDNCREPMKEPKGWVRIPADTGVGRIKRNKWDLHYCPNCAEVL